VKAVISSTYDNQYMYFIPICVWLWNRLGVEVICFMPLDMSDGERNLKFGFIEGTMDRQKMKYQIELFDCPKHKEATYAQCSRLYAGALDLPSDEMLMTSDIDMAVFNMPSFNEDGFSVTGFDLVPETQFPICYITAKKSLWQFIMNRGHGSYQECLDDLLGGIECESFRGNYWGKDQETAYSQISTSPINIHKFNRSNGENQFAQNRVDRDDINWRAYVNENLIDAHLWRPGYTEEAHTNIMELLTTMYPLDDFTWLEIYNQQYKKLL